MGLKVLPGAGGPVAGSGKRVLFSELLYDQVSRAGGVVELYIYPGAEHNLTAPFQLAMQRTLEFFGRYLKGP